MFRVGIEVVFVSVVEFGDKVFVLIFGCFGYLLMEIVECYGVDVYNIECEWGEVFDFEIVICEIKKVNLKIVVMVYGEMFIGRMQFFKEIGVVCCNEDILFIVDVVVIIGGMDVKVDEWNIDVLIVGI